MDAGMFGKVRASIKKIMDDRAAQAEKMKSDLAPKDITDTRPAVKRVAQAQKPPRRRRRYGDDGSVSY